MGARGGVVCAKTARELKFLFEDKDAAFIELVRLYEKARYAQQETASGRCRPEDVKRAEACRDVLLGKGS